MRSANVFPLCSFPLVPPWVACVHANGSLEGRSTHSTTDEPHTRLPNAAVTARCWHLDELTRLIDQTSGHLLQVLERRLSEVPPPIVRFRRERRRRNAGPTNVKCSGDVTSNAWLSVLAIFQCFVSFFFVHAMRSSWCRALQPFSVSTGIPPAAVCSLPTQPVAAQLKRCVNSRCRPLLPPPPRAPASAPAGVSPRSADSLGGAVERRRRVDERRSCDGAGAVRRLS